MSDKIETQGSGEDLSTALARLRGIRAEQASLRAELDALDEVELAAAHEAQARGASWEDLAAAGGLGAVTSAQRRYGPATVEDRRRASRASRKPVEHRQVDSLPGVSIQEAAKRLGITESQVRTRIANGVAAEAQGATNTGRKTLRSVEVTYRGRLVRRPLLND